MAGFARNEVQAAFRSCRQTGTGVDGGVPARGPIAADAVRSAHVVDPDRGLERPSPPGRRAPGAYR
jgi:hypothetical protein